MTVQTWKCPLCPQKISLNQREKHLQTHIDTLYEKERAAFHETQRAEALLKKITDHDH